MDIPSPSQPPARRRRRFLAPALAAAVAAAAAAPAIYVGQVGRSLAVDRPPEPAAPPAMVFLAADGTPFARQGTYKEPPVNAAELPPLVVGAFVAIEDRDFFSHGGIDLSGLARAMLANLSEGRVVQGGSTITQQLAKTYVGDDRTYGRKLEEAAVALALERRLTKEEILSRYLSSAYFGRGAYGLGAAARTYFDKSPQDLTLGEAAMLAGLLKAPSALAPTRDLAAAQARARLVLAAMVECGMIDAAQAAATAPAELAPANLGAPVGEFFRDWVVDQVDNRAPAYGEVVVPTTLDLKLQAAAERAVADVIEAKGAGSHAQEAALVAMRADGSVVAMVGGADYGQSQFNRVTQAHRQPGSSFKLFVYLAALRHGATADTLVEDEPITVEKWRPRNASGRYQGVMTFRDAFAQSSNVAAVRTSEIVGRGEVIRAARDLGVASELKPVPSLALGANEVTLLEMTSAYAAVAAGAYPVRPTGVVGGGAQATHGLPEQRDLLTLLAAAADQGAGLSGVTAYPSFGKTGTTQNNRDAWFIGFSGDLIVGVWVGNDDETPMVGVAGRGLPADIWRAFMTQVLPPPAPQPVFEPPPMVAEAPQPRRRFRFPDWLPSFSWP